MRPENGNIEPDPAGGARAAEISARPYGRRGFLILVAGGLLSLVWAGPVSRMLSPVTSAGSQILGNLLPVGGWRIYTISGTMPLFDPASWRLEIGGLVKRPLSLSYDDLKALPRARQVSTFHCVTGWTVGQRPLGRRPLPAPARLGGAPTRGYCPSASSRSSNPTRIRSRSNSSASRMRCWPTSMGGEPLLARTEPRRGSCCRRCTATRASSG